MGFRDDGLIQDGKEGVEGDGLQVGGKTPRLVPLGQVPEETDRHFVTAGPQRLEDDGVKRGHDGTLHRARLPETFEEPPHDVLGSASLGFHLHVEAGLGTYQVEDFFEGKGRLPGVFR